MSTSRCGILQTNMFGHLLHVRQHSRCTKLRCSFVQVIVLENVSQMQQAPTAETVPAQPPAWETTPARVAAAGHLPCDAICCGRPWRRNRAKGHTLGRTPRTIRRLPWAIPCRSSAGAILRRASEAPFEGFSTENQTAICKRFLIFKKLKKEEPSGS